MTPTLIITALKSLLESKIGPYVLIGGILILVVGGWKGFSCASQYINSTEEPNEVQDAVIPSSNEYDSLKLPEQ